MRLEPMARDGMSAEQGTLHDEMVRGVRKSLQGFKSQQEDGALIGPFPAMLHFPEFGRPLWELFTALSRHTTLPKPAHEIAILVTGRALHSRYELYSHERIAESAGLAPAKIATITAGERPGDLSQEEGLAYDIAALLSRGGQLGDTTYKAAVRTFGERGTAELFYLIGCYAMISTLLNGYDVPVPE